MPIYIILDFINGKPIARLTKPMVYFGWCVPEGFTTDFASIPRWLWSFLPPIGIYAQPAVLHDYLYTMGCVSRAEADLTFYEAMKFENVNFATRCLMYLAVRLFGKGHYQNGK